MPLLDMRPSVERFVLELVLKLSNSYLGKVREVREVLCMAMSLDQLRRNRWDFLKIVMESENVQNKIDVI